MEPSSPGPTHTLRSFKRVLEEVLVPDGGMPGTPPGASGLRPRPGPGQEPEADSRPLGEACAREVQELQHLPGLLGKVAPPVRPPAGLEGRVLKALRQKRTAEEKHRPSSRRLARWARWAAAAVVVVAMEARRAEALASSVPRAVGSLYSPSRG